MIKIVEERNRKIGSVPSIPPSKTTLTPEQKKQSLEVRLIFFVALPYVAAVAYPLVILLMDIFPNFPAWRSLVTWATSKENRAIWVVFMACFGVMAIVVMIHWIGIQLIAMRESEVNLEIALDDERGFFLLLRSHNERTNQIPTQDVFIGGAVPSCCMVSVPGMNVIWKVQAALEDYGRILVLGGNVSGHFRPLESTHIVLPTSDSNWRTVFRYLVDKCRAVFLIPELTSGLVEELDILTESGQFNKTVVIAMSGTISDNVENERVAKERWNKIASQLRSHNYNLPDFPGCALYVPNPDFSPKTLVSTGNSEGQIRKAFDRLMPNLSTGTPLREVAGVLFDSLYVRESLTKDFKLKTEEIRDS